MSYTVQPTKAQLRAQDRARCEAHYRDSFVEGHSRRPAAMAMRLFPADFDVGARIRATVAAWRDLHPDPGATREQAACHEAGHFAAAEAQGLVAGMAEIHGSPFGRAGWGGSAGALKRPVVEGPAERAHFTACDVRREGVFTLAGLYAEHAFGGGDLFSQPGELLEVCLIAARLADMRGIGRAAALQEVCECTARLVLGNRVSIELIARRLEVKKRISRYDRHVGRALATIRATPINQVRGPAPDQVADLSRVIMEAPVDLAAFIASIAS